MRGAMCIELKVVRQWHIDPGKYRVEEVETGSGEDTTVVDLPLRIKCPVLACCKKYALSDNPGLSDRDNFLQKARNSVHKIIFYH